MNVTRRIRGAVGLAMAMAIAPAFAEGPLNVGGPADAEGIPFRWNPANFPLTYWTDLGNLGSQTNTQADQLVNDAFTVWANVPTASISFTAAGELGGDVTGNNAMAVVNAIEGCGSLGIARERSIIYDTDGSVVDAILGAGNSDFTLGFATPACLTSNGIENSYNRGYAVMNGKNTSAAELEPVMIHEFGHMLGLDHSQVNVECLGFFGCSNDSAAGLPTMFPILVDTAAMSTPATDDIAGISALYPETVNDPPTGRVPFATTTGRITGRIFFSDRATQAQSFNVIARLVDNPATAGVNESKTTAVSSLSGFLFTADNGNPIVQVPGLTPSLNGTRDMNFAGYYEIPGLPPGNYTVEVEAIDNSFVEGSGVGPLGSLSIVFSMPSGVCPDGEFFDSAEADDDICTNSTPVTAVEGTTVTDRNIILNSTPPRYDAWEEGP